MAYTPQQQSNIRNTLGQISSTLSNISGMVKSNPSLTNQAYQGIAGATKQLQSGLGSYYNPQTKTWNLPDMSGFNPSNITPTISAEDLRSLKGMYSVSPYIPTDPSAFVDSINIDAPEQQQLSPVDLKLKQLESQREGYYNQIDEMPSVYKRLRDEAGITSGLAELQNVNKQILQKKLEFEQTNKQIAGQTIPTPIILKQQEVNRSAAAAEIAAYSAYAQSLQGNIEMASNLIDKSIDMEYKPILARIDYIKEQIKGINDKRAPFVQAQLDIYKAQVLDFTEQKRNAMNNAIFNKAPQSVFAKIQKAQTIEELASAGVNYIRDPKTVAEIANIYDQINKRGIETGGMSSKQLTAFNSIVSKYNSSPLIMASDRIAVLEDTIKNIKANPTNGAQQLNLAYSYIQALDTYQSAVREGELSLVSSIDSNIGKFQNSVEKMRNGQIVRKDVALQIAGAAENIVRTIKNAASEKAKSFRSQAVVNGIGDQWDQYIGGFSPGYGNQTTNTQFEEAAKLKVVQYTAKNINEMSRVGRMMKENPDLSYEEIAQILGL